MMTTRRNDEDDNAIRRHFSFKIDELNRCIVLFRSLVAEGFTRLMAAMESPMMNGPYMMLPQMMCPQPAAQQKHQGPAYEKIEGYRPGMEAKLTTGGIAMKNCPRSASERRSSS